MLDGPIAQTIKTMPLHFKTAREAKRRGGVKLTTVQIISREFLSDTDVPPEALADIVAQDASSTVYDAVLRMLNS